MWPFEKKSSKVEAGRTGMLAYTMPGYSRWTDRQKYLSEGYAQNIVAYRCINLIAREAAKVSWYLKAGEDEVEAHPILDLVGGSPSPGRSAASFWQEAYAWRLILGEAFLERVGSRTAWRELYCHPPHLMHVEPGKTFWPEYYEFQLSGAATRWDVDPLRGVSDILHIKSFNPLDSTRGMPPLQAAAMAVDKHNGVSQWNAALLQNNTVPSGVLNVSGALDDQAHDNLRKSLRDGFSGPMNARKPFVLQADSVSWISMAMGQQEMDYVNLGKVSAIEIAMAFDVPPQLVGITDASTYNNVAEAKLALYENAVLPLVDEMTNALNSWLLPDGRYQLCYDDDSIPAMEPRRGPKFERAKVAWEAGLLTANEARYLMGYGEVDGGDELYVSASKVPLALDEPPPEPVEEDPQDDDPQDDEPSPPGR